MPASLDGAEILYQLAHSLDDRRAQLVVTNSVLFSLATVAVGLRLWARYRIKAGFQMDDYLMIVAMVRNQTTTLCFGELHFNLAMFRYWDTVFAHLDFSVCASRYVRWTCSTNEPLRLSAVHFGLGRHVVIVGLARLSYYLRVSLM